jgi:hypothetical protein
VTSLSSPPVTFGSLATRTPTGRPGGSSIPVARGHGLASADELLPKRTAAS